MAGQTCRKQLVRCSVNSRWNTSHLISPLGLSWKAKMSHSCLLCVLSLSLSLPSLSSLSAFVSHILSVSASLSACSVFSLCLCQSHSVSVSFSICIFCLLSAFCQSHSVSISFSICMFCLSLSAFVSHIQSVSVLSACSVFSLPLSVTFHQCQLLCQHVPSSLSLPLSESVPMPGCRYVWCVCLMDCVVGMCSVCVSQNVLYLCVVCASWTVLCSVCLRLLMYL